MKLLFIDHECHKMTRSAEFFLSVLRKAFDVVEHYYSRYYRTGAQKVAKDCDIAVIWEFPISRWRFFSEPRQDRDCLPALPLGGRVACFVRTVFGHLPEKRNSAA